LHRWIIYIDRCYSEPSLSDSLRKGITQLLQQHGITPWYKDLLPSAEEDDYFLVTGPLQCFPEPLSYPYLDAHELIWGGVYRRGQTYCRLQGSLWLSQAQRSDANH
jgi:hypothetical protein